MKQHGSEFVTSAPAQVKGPSSVWNRSRSVRSGLICESPGRLSYTPFTFWRLTRIAATSNHFWNSTYTSRKSCHNHCPQNGWNGHSICSTKKSTLRRHRSPPSPVIHDPLSRYSLRFALFGIGISVCRSKVLANQVHAAHNCAAGAAKFL